MGHKHRSFVEFFTEMKNDSWSTIALKIVALIHLLVLLAGGIMLLTLYRAPSTIALETLAVQISFFLFLLTQLGLAYVVHSIIDHIEQNHNVSWLKVVPLSAAICFGLRTIFDAFLVDYAAGIDDQVLGLKVLSIMGIVFSSLALIVFILLKVNGVRIINKGGGRMAIVMGGGDSADESVSPPPARDMEARINAQTYQFVAPSGARPKITHQPAQKFE